MIGMEIRIRGYSWEMGLPVSRGEEGGGTRLDFNLNPLKFGKMLLLLF